jgi:acetamidase/formamidase
MRTALRQMIALITSRTNLSCQEAYQFCSLAGDFHVTQSVNGEKGIHALLKKGLLFQVRRSGPGSPGPGFRD